MHSAGFVLCLGVLACHSLTFHLPCLLLQWWAWPLYWVAQGTMFWALFVVGHDW